MVASLETRTAVKQILLDMIPHLDEKQRRILYGSAALSSGTGVYFLSTKLLALHETQSLPA